MEDMNIGRQFLLFGMAVAIVRCPRRFHGAFRALTIRRLDE
jgi:hypothetical protein